MMHNNVLMKTNLDSKQCEYCNQSFATGRKVPNPKSIYKGIVFNSSPYYDHDAKFLLKRTLVAFLRQ
jgi:hypothetical protein